MHTHTMQYPHTHTHNAVPSAVLGHTEVTGGQTSLQGLLTLIMLSQSMPLRVPVLKEDVDEQLPYNHGG